MSDPYLDLLDELRELTLKKRAGYSPGADPFANFRQSTMFGVDPVKGILVRVMDKLSRVASLLDNPDNDKIGESLRDNLLDAGNYLLIAVAFNDSKTEEPAYSVDEIGSWLEWMDDPLGVALGEDYQTTLDEALEAAEAASVASVAQMEEKFIPF